MQVLVRVKDQKLLLVEPLLKPTVDLEAVVVKHQLLRQKGVRERMVVLELLFSLTLPDK